MDGLALVQGNTDDAASAIEEEASLDITEYVPENKFQKAIGSWRSIDLSSLISQLDSVASEIVANQKDALVERKDVAQKTKDFRKLDDAGKLVEYKTLLKSYQSFVDLLTNHGKTSSSAFLQLYTPLSEAPDPFPLLEASIESLVASEETLPRLTSENEELQRRVNRLTSQLDATEQKLSAETKARKEAEDGSGSRIQDIESSWARVLEEKEDNWVAKEKTLGEKIENQDRLLKELKANYEVAQRLGQSEEASAANNAASSELELVTSELEKTSARLADIEARNEQLRIELARATSQASSSIEDDAVIVRLQNENSAMLRKLESAKFERGAETREWNTKIRQAERQKASVTRENQELRSKLQKWADYDELKREVNMLRTIELSVDEDLENDGSHLTGTNLEGKKDSLEQLLLARNKKLNNELTILRVSHRDLQKQFDKIRDKLDNTSTELEKSQKLSSTLENDLMRVQEEAANAVPSSGMSVAGTYTSRYPQSSRRGRSSPTSSIISGFDGPRLGSTSLETLRSGEAVGGGSGILPMVQAQRDRFKQKNQQLEEELSKTYATVTSLRQEVASLQKDNLSLYEKTRYVSAYSRGTNATTSSSFAQAPSHTSVYTGHDEDGASNRWKSQYEANISPFAVFRGRESARAYKRMSLPERMIFSMTRIVLATRASRNLFAAYCLGLHLLVFLMLYWMSAATGGSPVDYAGKAASAVVAGNLKDQSGHRPGWQREDFG